MKTFSCSAHTVTEGENCVYLRTARLQPSLGSQISTLCSVSSAFAILIKCREYRRVNLSSPELAWFPPTVENRKLFLPLTALKLFMNLFYVLLNAAVKRELQGKFHPQFTTNTNHFSRHKSVNSDSAMRFQSTCPGRPYLTSKLNILVCSLFSFIMILPLSQRYL